MAHHQKKALSAKAVLEDMKAGVLDAELMAKYRLSSQGLQSLLTKMLVSGLVSQADLSNRQPPRSRLSAREVVTDLKAGISDDQLKEKYHLSDKKLQTLFSKLIAANLVTQEDLDLRVEVVEVEVIEEIPESSPPRQHTLAQESIETNTAKLVEALINPDLLQKATELFGEAGETIKQFAQSDGAEKVAGWFNWIRANKWLLGSILVAFNGMCGFSYGLSQHITGADPLGVKEASIVALAVGLTTLFLLFALARRCKLPKARYVALAGVVLLALGAIIPPEQTFQEKQAWAEAEAEAREAAKHYKETITLEFDSYQKEVIPTVTRVVYDAAKQNDTMPESITLTLMMDCSGLQNRYGDSIRENFFVGRVDVVGSQIGWTEMG